MICIAEDDRDVLRFLWLEDIKNELPRIQVLRFTRVVFGVSSSPFLLNATIKHHIQSYLTRDPQFVTKFEQSIYVDDVGPTMMMRHSSFMRRRRLDWQKVVSISASLLPTPQSCKRINLQEVIGVTQFHTGQSEKIAAESESDVKSTLGDNKPNLGLKVLGIQWQPAGIRPQSYTSTSYKGRAYEVAYICVCCKLL